MAKLGDICTIQSGGTPSRSNKDYWDNGTIPWVKISDFSGKYLAHTSEKITQAGLDASSAKIFPKGTILYTIFATLGETCILDIDATTNQAIAGLRLNDDSVSLDYLYYYLLSKKGYVNELGRGVAQNNINMKILREMEITIPPKEEQERITEVLNKMYALIALRKAQLAKLDELVKARFVEMFGDPMANPMGWDRVNISAVVGGKVSNGFFAKRDDYCDDGNVKVLGVAHVVNRMYSNTEDLPKTNGTETDVLKYGVKYGDMLFCRSSLVAAGIGKASIVPKGTPNNVLFECHVIRLPLDLKKCVPEFMQVLSTTDYFRNQVIAQSKTATMTTIGQDGILKTDIILPPREMQKKFLAFVEQTDKSKLTIQASLDKLEVMKKALMQEYFG